jgi:cytochrome c peroxidase
MKVLLPVAAVLVELAMGGFVRLPVAAVGQGTAPAGSVPDGRGATAIAQEIELGRRLFSDRRLSRDESLACSTCHQPAVAFTDGRDVARGIDGREGRRNTPTLVNRALGRRFFFDGHGGSLDAAVFEPIENPLEMDMDLARAADRVGLTRERMSHALSSYVRSIRSTNSRVDQFLSGDADALSADEQAGLLVFNGQGNCASCHSGPDFSDEQVHNTGVSWTAGRLSDPGAGNGAFKTPTLRDIEITGPYMHNGSFSSLAEVIDFYDRVDPRTPHLDPKMRPVRLSQEAKRNLQLFLMALSGQIVEAGRPVRSGTDSRY